MGVGSKKAAAQAKLKKLGHLLDNDWMMSDEQKVWYEWGIKQGIIISPIPKEPGKWYVGVSTPDNYKKIYKSRFEYDWLQIWDACMESYKYYYDKHNRK